MTVHTRGDDVTTAVYMIEKVDGGYRRGRQAPPAAGYVFEGVDGDETANTVTYWYARRGEEQ